MHRIDTLPMGAGFGALLLLGCASDEAAPDPCASFELLAPEVIACLEEHPFCTDACGNVYGSGAL